MATNYPGALDSFSSPPATLSGTPTHSSMHTDVQDAVEAIETDLGTNPGDRLPKSFASASARDTAIPSPVAGNQCWRSDLKKWQRYDGSAWWDFGRQAVGVSLVSFTSGEGTITTGKTFTFYPIVSVVAQGSGTDLQVYVKSTSATTIVCTLYKDGSAHTGSVNIQWIAIEGSTAI